MEQKFIEIAKKKAIVNIKGHVYCPGIRISLYNGMPLEGVAYLVEFMRFFMTSYPNTNYATFKM
jgi:phosphoserine aminotransferase